MMVLFWKSMRNRMIKTDFWDDEKIGQISIFSRLVFIGIWNMCDDFGVCRAIPQYIRSSLFKYDDISIIEIEDALCQLSNKNLICLAEHENQTYLFVKNFKKHQKIDRPSKNRVLFCGDENCDDKTLKLFDSSNDRRVLVDASSTNIKDKVKEKEKEKEKGNTQQTKNNDQQTRNKFKFDTIYQEYPRKSGKKKAYEKLSKTIKTQDQFDNLLKAVKNYSRQIRENETEEKFIKHFSTFVNCWEDFVDIFNEIDSEYDALMAKREIEIQRRIQEAKEADKFLEENFAKLLEAKSGK
jgi:hypothetical protein